MKVAITGATGMIGTALTRHLLDAGDEVVGMSRPQDWDPATGSIDLSVLAGVDAVVHLAGVGIGDHRWTDEYKHSVLESRRSGTTLIAESLARLDDGPRILLSGSAIGYYGDTGDHEVDEQSPAGDDILAGVCVEWEAPTAIAADAGVRVALLRTGVVLSRSGGALAKQLPAFKFGLGGRAGSGRQWLSWIHIADEIAAIDFLLRNEIGGPVNLTAPNPATNAEFTKALGAAVHRPTTVLPMFGPRLLFGRELADTLLLTSQRVRCAVLDRAGFEFRHPTLDGALADLLA